MNSCHLLFLMFDAPKNKIKKIREREYVSTIQKKKKNKNEEKFDAFVFQMRWQLYYFMQFFRFIHLIFVNWIYFTI